jgi:predicted amidohydrolase YtcJ
MEMPPKGGLSGDNMKYKNHIKYLGFVSLAAMLLVSCTQKSKTETNKADIIVKNAKVFSHANGIKSSFAVKDGKFVALGDENETSKWQGEKTNVIDANGKTIIPGLIDTHHHPIRAGLNYNLELRWDGVKSLKQGLQMIREQAQRTPGGQWVRVVGGWSPHQFKENRFPTLKELNDASPDKPLFVMYPYSRGFLNKAGIERLGYNKDTKFPGGEVQLDKKGKPTGMLLAKPNAFILYKTLVSAPKLSGHDQEANSTKLYFQELSRFGLTTVIDAGGGGFYFPEDHRIAKELNDKDELAVNLPFFLFAPTPGKELADYERWTKMVHPATAHEISHFIPYHMVGGGENLTNAAADFENFLEPRPDLPPTMEKELKPILALLFKSNWIFRIHATYDESIERILNVVEELKKEGGPFPERFIIDHAETITDKNLQRIKNLGGGISIQDRMAFQGEDFVKRYGVKAAQHAPPIAKILELGIPLGSGTDATRVSTFNPWISLYWMSTGKTVGGFKHLSPENILSREKALHLMTQGAAWFSKEENVKGDIALGKVADFAILSADYFAVPEQKIKDIYSVLTVRAGKVRHASDEFKNLAPEEQSLKAIPEWSPVNFYGGYQL